MNDVARNDNLAPASRHQPHLRDYLGILYTRRWILISTVLLITLLSVVYVLVQTPIYRATCRLTIEPTRTRVVQTDEVYDPTFGAEGGNQILRREFLETQFLLILRRPSLEQTFGDGGFAELPEFAKAKDPIEAFAKLFTVRGIRNSYMVDVSFDWKDREVAKRTVRLLVDLYLKSRQERVSSVTMSGLQTLRAKKEEMRPQLDAKAAALQQFVAQHNMVSLNEGQDIMVERLKEISRAQTQAEMRLIQARTRLENIRQALETSPAPESMPEILDSQTVRDLKLEYVRTQALASDLAGSFGQNHPQLLAARSTLAALQERLQAEVQSVLATTQAAYERASEEESKLSDSLRKEEQRVHEMNSIAEDYRILKESYDVLHRDYNAVNERMGEIEIALAAGGGQLVTADPVLAPADPVKPRKKRTVALAGILSFLLGCGLCFFLDYLDMSVKTKEDVEALLPTTVIGYVPSFQGENGHAKNVANMELLPIEHPRSPAAEAFRSIRTALSFTRGAAGCHQFAITSALPSEGKTIVCANVAVTIAQSGKRVLLVDADLRKPRVHKVFKISSARGLSNALAHHEEAADVFSLIAPGCVPNLSLLPSGPIPPNPAELLGSPRMAELIKAFASQYDYVIYDTPPTVNVTDAAVLSRQIGGALLVVRSFVTDRNMTRHAGEVIIKTGGRLLGVILNGLDAPQTGYGYYSNYYSQYYALGDEARASEGAAAAVPGKQMND